MSEESRIEKLQRIIPKLKASKKINPIKIEALEWELKYRLATESKPREDTSLVDYSIKFWVDNGKPIMTHAYCAKLLKTYHEDLHRNLNKETDEKV